MSPHGSDVRVRGECTAEEAAAVVAAMAARRIPAPEADPYEDWRRRRIEALRRAT